MQAASFAIAVNDAPVDAAVAGAASNGFVASKRKQNCKTLPTLVFDLDEAAVVERTEARAATSCYI